MIEIDYSLLSNEALDNLLIDIITRQSSDYGDYSVALLAKKQQLLHQLHTGEVVIVFNAQEECCNVVKAETFNAWLASQDVKG